MYVYIQDDRQVSRFCNSGTRLKQGKLALVISLWHYLLLMKGLRDMMMMRKKTIIMNFHVTLDLGESYLSGTATGNLGAFPVNLQGGAAEIVLPVDLLGSLYSQPSTARLTMNTESGMVVTLDAKLSSGRNIIEIYDDALLEKLAHMAYGEMQIEIEAAT